MEWEEIREKKETYDNNKIIEAIRDPASYKYNFSGSL
jgi:hypothetical protein